MYDLIRSQVKDEEEEYAYKERIEAYDCVYIVKREVVHHFCTLKICNGISKKKKKIIYILCWIDRAQ